MEHKCGLAVSAVKAAAGGGVFTMSGDAGSKPGSGCADLLGSNFREVRSVRWDTARRSS
jgi:hypothetical protein